MNISKLYNARHILIIGATGSGKTYFATRYARRLPFFVFVNTQEEHEVSRVSDAVCYSVDEMKRDISEGATRIEFIPSENTSKAVLQLKEIRSYLFEVGNIIQKRWCTIFIDEADIYAPKSGGDIDNFFKRGRKRGIQAVAITQRPASLSHSVITQCDLQVVFAFNPYEMLYFDHYKIPVKDHSDWIEKRYHYLLIDSFGNVSRMKPVK